MMNVGIEQLLRVMRLVYFYFSFLVQLKFMS